MVDIPFSYTFYKWVLGQDQNIDLSDMQHVDVTLYNSLSQLYEVVLQKKHIESEGTHAGEALSLALSSLTLDGVPIDELGLDFVLPGTSIDLKKNGSEIPVTINNLEEYLMVSFTITYLFYIFIIFIYLLLLYIYYFYIFITFIYYYFCIFIIFVKKCLTCMNSSFVR